MKTLIKNKFTLVYLLFLSFSVWILFVCFSFDKRAQELYPTQKKLIIGSKIFTENILLGEIIAQLLEQNYGFQITRKFNMGGTKLLFDALKTGSIDLYPEYTGTGYAMILKESKKLSPQATYTFVQKKFLKKYQMLWSPPLGFENTYVLALRKNDSRFKNVSLNSDLEHLDFPLKIASEHEFTERKDGWKLFKQSYKLKKATILSLNPSLMYTAIDNNKVDIIKQSYKLKKATILSLNPSLMYTAIDNNKVDIIVSYSTDGRIQNYQLKTLKDDKNFFPSYLASYLTTKRLIKSQPELKEAFQALEGQISPQEMRELNRQVEQLKKSLPEVASHFLLKKDLLKDIENKTKAQSLSLSQESLLSYYYKKRGYFFKILKEHLILVFTALFLALLFSFPLSLWAVYNKRVEKLLFFFVNILQTIPSMALLGALIPFLGIGFTPAITALFIYSLLHLIRNIFEGIKNIDSHSVEVSAGIGLNQWQTLRNIQIPLAMPIIIAGVRTALILLVGTATLAAFIGAGGLGDPIFRGIATLDSRLIFMGAVPACVLALFLDKSLNLVEKLLISKGLQKRPSVCQNV